MQSFLMLLDSIVTIITWIVIVNVAVSWLLFLQIFNSSNKIVHLLHNSTHQILSPILNPIRRVVSSFFPKMYGLDVAPILLLLMLWFLRNLAFEALS